MGFKQWFKEGIGLAGKHLMNVANASTGGLAGKIGNDILNYANKNAGLIGKGLNKFGHWILNDRGREKVSNAADKVLEQMPKSWKVSKVLNKINDAAQGRTSPSQRPRSIKKRTTNKQFQKQRQELDDRIKQRQDAMQQRQIVRLNSINHDDDT